MSHRVVIGIGSNTSQRKEAVSKAIKWLETILSDCVASEPYLTKPEATLTESNDYINAVAAGQTDMSPKELSEKLKAYESENGRSDRLKNKGIVAIDLDLVIYDNDILRPEEITRYYFSHGYDQIKPIELRKTNAIATGQT